MQNMSIDILNEEFEIWMCGIEGHKGPCPPEGCDRGKCVREQVAIASTVSHVVAALPHAPKFTGTITIKDAVEINGVLVKPGDYTFTWASEDEVEALAMARHRVDGLAVGWDCCPEEYRKLRREDARRTLAFPHANSHVDFQK